MRDRDMNEARVRKKGGGFFFGFLVGGLTGAAVGLLMAPRSGPETRALLMDKGIEIKEQVEDTARDAQAQATSMAQDLRSRAEAAIETTRSKAETALDTTRSKVQRKTSQISHTVEAAKEAAQEAWTAEEQPAANG